ncbi:MAG TPA: VWA domain-containing protein, partial [Bryobacterales bacterium]|nr:VWA domain-containing protein [Bryobacterales bacterium]
MSLANLTVFELLALAAAGAAFITFLYLLDRSRRRRVVPSLRFWTEAGVAPAARRKRILEPLSLLLQLAAFFLLMLAIAGLRTGDPGPTAADHVLLLDASAWMAAAPQGRPLMEEVRRLGLEYVRSLPPGDRVMVI